MGGENFASPFSPVCLPLSFFLFSPAFYSSMPFWKIEFYFLLSLSADPPFPPDLIDSRRRGNLTPLRVTPFCALSCFGLAFLQDAVVLASCSFFFPPLLSFEDRSPVPDTQRRQLLFFTMKLAVHFQRSGTPSVIDLVLWLTDSPPAERNFPLLT